MDKRIAGLLGAAAALTSMTSANAAGPASVDPLQATSYADLLNSVPNALAQLIADDTAREGKSRGEVDVAQVRVEVDHHHHHRYRRRHKRHHHHHHSNFMVIPRAAV